MDVRSTATSIKCMYCTTYIMLSYFHCKKGHWGNGTTMLMQPTLFRFLYVLISFNPQRFPPKQVLVFPTGTMATKVVVVFFRHNQSQPVTADVLIHACLKPVHTTVMTSPVTTTFPMPTSKTCMVKHACIF